MTNKQINLWQGEFGKEYTERNSRSPKEWDEFYIENWGLSKLDMNERCFGSLSRDVKILEVGCNTGMQLEGLQRMGFNHLYGIEIQDYAVEKAKSYTKGINIIEASGFDIPFKDGFFDLVLTNGVLIHIAPENLKRIMTEIYRCSNAYISGFEYYADELKEISYRGNDGYMWKGDYCALYQEYFTDLILINKKKYEYVSKENDGNEDCIFLLKK